MTNQIVASGAVFYAKSSKRFLLLQKATGKHALSWGLVGGTSEEDENPWEGLHREVQEEIGFFPEVIKTIPLETFVSNDTVFNFHTYLCVVNEEFIPKLSDEHCGWAWTTIDTAPRPLHQGLRNSFSSKIIRAKIQTILDIIDFF